MKIPDDVIVKSGLRPGKTVAIFCGVHGNERAGILAVDRLATELEPMAGTVYLVRANPPAIEANVRLVNSNLNRLFSRRVRQPETYEGTRVQELMGLLDGCDALLDLHSYPETVAPNESVPFAICEPECFPLAAQFDVPVVVSGFASMEDGGSDGYMHAQGKIGICVELGALERPERFMELGVATAKTFLAHFGCLPASSSPTPRPQRRLRLTAFRKKTSADFRLAKPFRNLEPVAAGEHVATENGLTLHAAQDSYIIFPNASRPVGVEAFLLAAG